MTLCDQNTPSELSHDDRQTTREHSGGRTSKHVETRAKKFLAVLHRTDLEETELNTNAVQSGHKRFLVSVRLDSTRVKNLLM